MPHSQFIKRTRIEAPAQEVFAWHARPGALERLMPPWSRARVKNRTGGIEKGARVELEIPVGPMRRRWVAEHTDYAGGRMFKDVQIAGPFARWEHTHRFEPDGPEASYLEDRIDYELPLGVLGRILGGGFAHGTLARMFAYRHRLTALDVAAHRRYSRQPLHVAVSGSSGLVGSALVAFLTTGGHGVTRLVRSGTTRSGSAHWDPGKGVLDAEALAGVDAVVHLAGESIVGRWNAAKKARILDSRIRGTSLLAQSLAALDRRPATLVCASAIGFYGDRGDVLLDESSKSGSGFLAKVCRQWEAATKPAADAGIRVVHVRIGIVITAAGGALATMLPVFQAGAGGVLGPGTQYMSWISLDDLLGAILHCLTTESLRGPVNAVAPEPVTNRDFTKTLGRVLGRPTILPLPAFGVRLAFGEAADDMLLASARVRPGRLGDTGYDFRDPDLETALRHTLGRATQS